MSGWLTIKCPTCEKKCNYAAENVFSPTTVLGEEELVQGTVLCAFCETPFNVAVIVACALVTAKTEPGEC